MKQRHYIIIAIVSYLIFTLINTPAATVLSLVEDNMNIPVKFYGVQGSIWDGRSDRVMIQGQQPLDNLHWSINPLSLLLASLSADIQAQVQQQNIVGSIRLGPTGNLSGSDIRARLDASQVQQMLAMPFGELAGVFNIDIESLQWSGTGLPEARGTIEWQNAGLTIVESVDLGHVDMNIKPGKDGTLEATLKNRKGDLGIEGNASLADNNNYMVDVTFIPQNNARNSIKESLAMFARRQSNGSYRLRKSGNLKQLGL